MIKKILSAGVIAGMIACGQAPEENQGNESHENGTEEMHDDHDDHGNHEGHDHESHEGHDHDAHDHEGNDHNGEAGNDRLHIESGASVFFVNLNDGDVVSSPVKVEMGLSGMEILPAGKAKMHTGHHHILINNEKGFHDMGSIVPANATNIHFGKGQTETELNLEPGKYTLSLQFANGLHESYGEQMSASVNIVVQ